MLFNRRGLLLALGLLVPFSVIGCTTKADGDPEVQKHKGDLIEIYDLYTTYVKKNQRPPQKLADLTQKEQQTVAPGAASTPERRIHRHLGRGY